MRAVAVNRNGRLRAASLAAWLALAAALAAAPSAPAVAQSLETSVKANYLARFAAFVQWPPGSGPAAGSPLMICVVGDDPFGRQLDQALEGQSVNGHRIAARRLARLESGSGCHIAYLAGSSAQTVAAGLAAAGRGVLTVTDEARGTERGAIHFVLFQTRVRFHVDAGQASRRGLTISSRLLTLALSVRET